MHRPSRTATAIVVAAAAAASIAAASPALASPQSDGCPSGYQAHTTEEWAALGYPNAPRFVDDPANGGNGDNVACGRELGQGTSKQTPSGKVLYQFRDNDLAPAS